MPVEGPLRLTWFSALNMSARTWTFARSETRKFFAEVQVHCPTARATNGAVAQIAGTDRNPRIRIDRHRGEGGAIQILHRAASAAHASSRVRMLPVINNCGAADIVRAAVPVSTRRPR